jgi:hypothetical protein
MRKAHCKVCLFALRAAAPGDPRPNPPDLWPRLTRGPACLVAPHAAGHHDVFRMTGISPLIEVGAAGAGRAAQSLHRMAMLAGAVIGVGPAFWCVAIAGADPVRHVRVLAAWRLSRRLTG